MRFSSLRKLLNQWFLVVWLNSLRKFYDRHYDLASATELLCPKWSRICSVCPNHNIVLSSFTTFQRVWSNGNTSTTLVSSNISQDDSWLCVILDVIVLEEGSRLPLHNEWRYTILELWVKLTQALKLKWCADTWQAEYLLFVFCFVIHCLSFCHFHFSHHVVCTSIFCFW